MLGPTQAVRLPSDAPPVLVVVVDTEEEFEWGTFDREATSVKAMSEIHRFQEACDEFQVRPTYVVDYPIATQEEGRTPLREFLESRRAVVGAHLHPWVNPPLEEPLTPENTYPGNLGSDLERRKVRVLVEAIERGLGVRPTVYKAGRYGLGPATAAILEAEGFEVDLSVAPPLDLSAAGGPDYSRASAEALWFGRARRLLELPVSGGYVGYLGRAGAALSRLAASPWLRWSRLQGILSRIGALERIRLSPEGTADEDNRRLTKTLLRRGVRIFQFSLHSPSLAPGYTPYVKDAVDRQQLLDRCRSYFEFFLRELHGVALTPLELKARLERGA